MCRKVEEGNDKGRQEVVVILRQVSFLGHGVLQRQREYRQAGREYRWKHQGKLTKAEMEFNLAAFRSRMDR